MVIIFIVLPDGPANEPSLSSGPGPSGPAIDILLEPLPCGYPLSGQPYCPQSSFLGLCAEGYRRNPGQPRCCPEVDELINTASGKLAGGVAPGGTQHLHRGQAAIFRIV